MVLLHGFVGGVGSWREVVHALPEGIAVAALPLPGHSPNVPACADFAATCAWLAEQLQQLAPRPLHLVGYSLGGRLALGITVGWPQVAACATFVGAHTGLDAAADRQARRDADAAWCRLLAAGDMHAFVQAWEQQPLWAGQSERSPARAAAQRRMRLAHDPRGLLGSLQSTGLGCMPPYGAQLAQLRQPTQWLAGEHDARFAAQAKMAAGRSPRGQFAIVPESGHNPLLDSPQALAALLAHFFIAQMGANCVSA
jgi:2-succinyl-6-hydroxy-2,4-cyclohexadiene-1-carboxylate synthase